MLQVKSTAIQNPATDASFDPYGRLLRMLMPSLQGVVVHDGFSNLVWASDAWDLADEPDLIKGAIANALSDTAEFAGVVRTLDADRAVYSFAIRGEHIELLGIVSLVARLSGKLTEARPLQTVRQLVQPALECLRRELALRSKLGSRERDLDVRERDLDLMLEISSHQSTAASDSDEFGLIMKTGLERMGCVLAALWVPDKNIAMSLTRSGQPMSRESLQRAEHHLLAWMQLQQRTMVVNHISKVASDVAAPYKILACPVRHPSERVMGVLALFNPPSAPDFDLHQTRIAEVLAKRATSIIQAQYDSSTGLMTRQAFERQAAALLASATSAESHIILYLDIDRLHVINETFGMHVGDDVIVSVAECMAKSLPAGALSARISGDRLAALVPNSNMDTAAVVAEKIR
ncbi:MAG TPA: GGDEF domain-containing protein, partial [Steroidobacteraceae bacterium]